VLVLQGERAWDFLRRFFLVVLSDNGMFGPVLVAFLRTGLGGGSTAQEVLASVKKHSK
jgi:hypothetical protein